MCVCVPGTHTHYPVDKTHAVWPNLVMYLTIMMFAYPYDMVKSSVVVFCTLLRRIPRDSMCVREVVGSERAVFFSCHFDFISDILDFIVLQCIM